MDKYKNKMLYITALNRLNIIGNLDRGDKIANDIFITNSSSKIEDLVEPSFYELAGRLETATILSSKAIIYSLDDISIDVTDPQTLLKNEEPRYAKKRGMVLTDHAFII